MGGGVVVNPTALGFKTYLRPLPEYRPLFGAVPDAAAAAAAAAARGKWHVNYAVYLRVDCALSKWGAWAPCDVTCGGAQRAVTQLRTRSVVRHGYGEGTACPSPTSQALFGRRACGRAPCPVDCVVAHWGLWGTCRTDAGARVSCDGTGIKTRRRKIRRKAAHGGVMCPPRSAVLACSGMPCAKDTPALLPSSGSRAGNSLSHRRHDSRSMDAFNKTEVRAVLGIGEAAASRLRTHASLQRFERMLQRLVAPPTTTRFQQSDFSVKFAPESTSALASRTHTRLSLRIRVSSAAVAAAVAARLQADDVAALLLAGSAKLIAPPTIVLPHRHGQDVTRQAFSGASSSRAAIAAAAFFAAAALLVRARSERAAHAEGIARRSAEEAPLSQARRGVAGESGGTGDGIGMLPLALAAGVTTDALRRSVAPGGEEETF